MYRGELWSPPPRRALVFLYSDSNETPADSPTSPDPMSGGSYGSSLEHSLGGSLESINGCWAYPEPHPIMSSASLCGGSTCPNPNPGISSQMPPPPCLSLVPRPTSLVPKSSRTLTPVKSMPNFQAHDPNNPVSSGLPLCP
ncbi:unnamed protein product [Mesocestoides corti]|uniref:Pleckstrin homology-like domain family B member 2 n=1 Tax=Mesocestoides corti TaxID=53468 RepID=A0A0R3UM31_MESCO|nr:unnamed protein product [Mesocestoides corti]